MSYRRPCAFLILLCWLVCTTPVFAQSSIDCSAVKSDKERLSCYDASNKKNGMPSPSDKNVTEKAVAFIRRQLKSPRHANFGPSIRAMRSNGAYSMDTVCGLVNGMGYFYWVEKDDGGIDDGSMAKNIGYGMWCKGLYQLGGKPPSQR